MNHRNHTLLEVEDTAYRILELMEFLNNVTLEEWELVINTIVTLKEKGPLYDYVGICRNLTEYACREEMGFVGNSLTVKEFCFYQLVDALSIGWEHHSGILSTPVSGNATWDKNTIAGKQRHELLDFIHEAAIKNLQNWLTEMGHDVE